MNLYVPFLLFYGTDFSAVTSEEVSFLEVTGTWSTAETFKLSENIQFQKERAHSISNGKL